MFTYRSETVFSKLIAVRYLGGILELPTFWAENNCKYHGAVVKKLCERVCHLIQDVDIDLLDDINKHITSDTEGIDILGDAILVGTYGWIRQSFAEDLVAEPWHRPLIELIQQLRWHVLFS
jgi:hypothetical protein